MLKVLFAISLVSKGMVQDNQWQTMCNDNNDKQYAIQQ